MIYNINKTFRVAAMEQHHPVLDRTNKTDCTASSVLKSQLVYLMTELAFCDERLSNLAVV